MKDMLVCMGLVLYSAAACGQVVRFEQSMDHVNIGLWVQNLEDPDGRLDISKVSAPPYSQRFAASKDIILNFGFSNSIHWIRFSVDNQTRKDLVLEVAQAFLPSATLYFRSPGGAWDSLEAGYRQKMDKKPIKSAFQVFPLKTGVSDYWIRLVSYTHPVPLKIWKRSSYELAAARQNFFYGLYAGILLFVIIINIFLFFSLRKTYYLHYALLVLLYLATSAAVMEGYIVYLFPGTELMNWYVVIPAINMPVLLSYLMSFLELKKYSPTGYRIGFWVCIYFLLYLGWMHFMPLLTEALVNQIHALSLFLLVVTLSLLSGKKGNRLGHYFAAAYAIWFILVAVEVLYIQTGHPSYIFGMSYVSIAIFTEVFLLAYLLVRRFEWERAEEQRRRSEAEIGLARMQQNYQQEILRARLEIQEHILNKISGEIHDNIGQILSVAKINLSTLDLKNPDELEQKTQDARRQVSRAIVDLRSLSHTLNGNAVQSIGFIQAIGTELDLVRKAGISDVVYEVGGTRQEIDPQKELILFRIFQEAINNVMSHSAARVLRVNLAFESSRLFLRISDDGRGFDTQAPLAGSGVGNMMSRAALVGADFAIDSLPGQGTTVRIELPLN